MSINLYIKENIIKNVFILIITALLYPLISRSLAEIKFEQTNDFLLTISMLLVTVCFANFAFTYEKTKLQTKIGKLLAHCATGVFMLLIALLLESMVIAIGIVYQSLHTIILVFSILLYIGIILYDFWDLMRVQG